MGILRVKDGFDYSGAIGEDNIAENMVENTAEDVVYEGDEDGEDSVTEAIDETNAEENVSMHPGNKKTTLMRTASTSVPLESLAMANIEMFRDKQKKTGIIDVWWLYDDGGLTLLLPHILTTRKQFKSCKLRVFTLANRNHALDQQQRKMAMLLAKFRIDFTDVNIIPDVTKKADSSTKAEFEEVISGCDIPIQELKHNLEKTNRHLRLAELLRLHSSDSEMIVMTLPLPRRGQTSPALYMAWLDIMTRNLPTILLTRGNQEPVLTFYS